MSSTLLAEARVSLADATRRYEAMTPRSREAFNSAVESLAGGTTRTTVFFAPYPPLIVRGEGCAIEDLDGNRRIDFLNNYTSLILGHADPCVVSAVVEQAQRGSAFAAPTENELRLGPRICSRVPAGATLR